MLNNAQKIFLQCAWIIYETEPCIKIKTKWKQISLHQKLKLQQRNSWLY